MKEGWVGAPHLAATAADCQNIRVHRMHCSELSSCTHGSDSLVEERLMLTGLAAADPKTRRQPRLELIKSCVIAM